MKTEEMHGTQVELWGESLHEWGRLEDDLRVDHGYESCIFGLGRECPPERPVRCAACERDPEATEWQD